MIHSDPPSLPRAFKTFSIIETELIPNSTSEEGKVFYYKMKGDYHRYLAEFQVRRTWASAAQLEALIHLALACAQPPVQILTIAVAVERQGSPSR